jgi:glycosyltransferase involved in cell wall biosynthesis
MAEGVSVIICCYNSVNRISETLRHLALQKTSQSLLWEVILVDNASTDNTADAARSYWTGLNQPVKLSIIQEQKPGLSHARATGIAAAFYSIAIFCDDDNWMAENYVEEAYAVMLQHPEVGIAGGWCEGVYEIPLKPYLQAMLPALAIGRQNFDNQHEPDSVYGAGMVIRKSCYEYITQAGGDSLLDDRKGKVLASGGDSEICYKVKLAGYKLLVDEHLYFRHYMPAGRLSASYFFKLCLKHVSPVIVLSQYGFIYRNGVRSYSSFYRSFMLDYTKRFFYFAPRMLLGKHKFYSLISFLQVIKVSALVTFRYSFCRDFYLRIAQKKKALARETR